MLKIITTLTLFLVGILAKGQVIETRTVSEFSKVKVQDGIELIYTDSNEPLLRIEAPNNSSMKNVITQVKGKTLVIKMGNQKESATSADHVVVYLATNHLSELKAESNAVITLSENLSTERLKISLQSASKFSGSIVASRGIILNMTEESTFVGKIESPSFVANISDKARVSLNGKASEAQFFTSKNALLSARNFTSYATKIKAHDHSQATIYANNTLIVDIADEAKVNYFGFPDQLDMNEDAIAYQKFQAGSSVTVN